WRGHTSLPQNPRVLPEYSTRPSPCPGYSDRPADERRTAAGPAWRTLASGCPRLGGRQLAEMAAQDHRLGCRSTRILYANGLSPAENPAASRSDAQTRRLVADDLDERQIVDHLAARREHRAAWP